MQFSRQLGAVEPKKEPFRRINKRSNPILLWRTVFPSIAAGFGARVCIPSSGLSKTEYAVILQSRDALLRFTLWRQCSNIQAGVNSLVASLAAASI